MKQYIEPGFCVRVAISKTYIFFSDKIISLLTDYWKKGQKLARLSKYNAENSLKAKINEEELETERL